MYYIPNARLSTNMSYRNGEKVISCSVPRESNKHSGLSPLDIKFC